LKDVIDCFELTDGRLLGIATNDASSNNSMSRKLQSTLEASGIEWLALRIHIPCMAHVIKLALGVFTSRLGVKGRTMSWEANERDQQIGENERIDIRKSQRLRKEGNARINKVLAMRPGLTKIIENISKMYFSHWKPQGVSERMRSVNLDASIAGQYETLGGHSCWPSE
jgi:hypothetical protein